MTKDQQSMLDECLNAGSGLTPWELQFIEDLDSNWRDRELSVKQSTVLSRINLKALEHQGEDD